MTTAAESIMVDMARLGVVLTVEGDRLRYRAPAGILTAELRTVVAANRAEILARLAMVATPDAAKPDVATPTAPERDENGRVKAGTVANNTPRCRPHVDPRDWIDDPADWFANPPADGQIRTNCRRCATWIGNRPVEVAQAGRRKQAAKAPATIFGKSESNPQPNGPTP